MKTNFTYQKLSTNLSIWTVVLLLGWSSAAVAQTPLTFEISSQDPFDSLPGFSDVSDYIEFGDLDGDGDKDMLVTAPINGNFGVYYYENTGTAAAPSYTLQMGSSNPVAFMMTANAAHPKLVDIDGDGDLDIFAPRVIPNSSAVAIYYFENRGTATNPSFSNSAPGGPLNAAAGYFNGRKPSFARTYFVNVSFVDIDGDGDFDCFMTPICFNGNGNIAWLRSTVSPGSDEDRLVYLENIGTATTPNFQRQQPTNNPLNYIATNLGSNSMMFNSLLFLEGSSTSDGDFDLLTYNAGGLVTSKMTYHENIGTATNPSFIEASYDILDTAYARVLNNASAAVVYSVADIDSDGKLEAIIRSRGTVYYLEDETFVNLRQIYTAQPVQVYPNPTTGALQLEQPLTGTAHIYSTLGQELHTEALEQSQQLDLSHLPKGSYFLLIRTGEKNYRQTIILE